MQCDERLQMIMLSGGRTTSLECIAFICQNTVGVFGVSLQNTAVQGILSRPDLIALGYLLYSINGTADIKSRWRHNRKSAQVVNSDLVCNPTIQQPGFDLLRQQWSLLNHFRTEQGHCGACRRKWRLTDTDQCPFGPHCRILSPGKTEWRLISATLCGWRRCFVADQLWLITCIREEECTLWHNFLYTAYRAFLR